MQLLAFEFPDIQIKEHWVMNLDVKPSMQKYFISTLTNKGQVGRMKQACIFFSLMCPFF